MTTDCRSRWACATTGRTSSPTTTISRRACRSPTRSGPKTVIRGGAGWFYDRAGDGAIREVLRSREERLYAICFSIRLSGRVWRRRRAASRRAPIVTSLRISHSIHRPIQHWRGAACAERHDAGGHISLAGGASTCSARATSTRRRHRPTSSGPIRHSARSDRSSRAAGS